VENLGDKVFDEFKPYAFHDLSYGMRELEGEKWRRHGGGGEN